MRKDKIMEYISEEAMKFNLPSIRDICAHCNIPSTASALHHLKSLVAEGKLMKVKGAKYIPTDLSVSKKHPL